MFTGMILTATEAKLNGLEKKANSCRKLHLKDEQRLYKLRWELATSVYKKHVLLQEAMALAGSTPQHKPKKMVLFQKQVNFRKLFLKETQKLAKKKWERACCHTKAETLVQELIPA